MKTIRIIFASIVLMIALSACGNNNQGGTDNNNTENSENTLNTTEDIQPDTMTNDEDDTFDYNRTQDDDYMRSKIPMGRLGEVDESAAMVCFMASEECSFTTASTFDTSGGRTTF